MQINERDIKVSIADNKDLIAKLSEATKKSLPSGELPIRFAVTESKPRSFKCEVGAVTGVLGDKKSSSIFEFKKRAYENTNQFNAVLLVPTGVGAELGGHSGDAGPLSRLIAATCDNLITHPNVVNASDINELPENGQYVEGSVITRLLMGAAGLQKVRSNRIMLVIDSHDEDIFFDNAAINSASAARAALGVDLPLVVKMNQKIMMRAHYSTQSERAIGTIDYFDRLCDVLDEHRGKYDAVALSSVIMVPEHYHADYFKDELEMLNPWGGVEAMLTHAVSTLYDLPSAHSPMMSCKATMDLDVGVADPRKAAEAVSVTYLHCILKGLHKSPKIVPNPNLEASSSLFTVKDISCLITPYGCVGLPLLAAIEQGIPVIAVKSNTNKMKNVMENLPFASNQLHVVENYLEAVGVMQALKAGVALDSIKRPIARTTVVEYSTKPQLAPQNKIRK